MACPPSLFGRLRASHRLIQGPWLRTDPLLLAGTCAQWSIEDAMDRLPSNMAAGGRVHGRSNCYSCPTGRTPLSPSQKHLLQPLAAVYASTQQRGSRSWMLEMLCCTTARHRQPPARFCPAAAVYRAWYLVLGDFEAVSVALMYTTALNRRITLRPDQTCNRLPCPLCC
jgi:hypothetical protein